MTFDDEEHRVRRVLDEDPGKQNDNSELNEDRDTQGDNSKTDISAEDLEIVEHLKSEDNSISKEQESGSESDSDQPSNDQSLEGDLDKNSDSPENNGNDSRPRNAQGYITDAEPYITPAMIRAREGEQEAADRPMGLIDHLAELRKRLTRIVIIIILGFFGFYGVSEMAYAYLALPLTQLLPEGSTLIYTSPQGAFFTYLKVSVMLSIIGTSPLTFYQLWAFIAPGLYEEEQGAIIPLALFSALFFVGGAAFCYFLVFPIAFKFFLGFTTATIIPMISIEEYLSFALKLVIAFGLVFEMPLFSYFLAKLRLITPEGMRKYRKYAVLMIFVVAAILTPPDVFSQVLMALPMILLYEVSIYITKVARSSADKRHEKKQSPENTQSQES